MKKLAVLTGAGISAESGLQTFRDKGGLWEKYDFQKLASIEGWRENPELVLEFYNIRCDLVRKAQPNAAHLALTQLERMYDVDIITQNVDDLHERAGSKHILHLHGEIMKARSSIDDQLIYELGEKNIKLGDKCEKGSQLRPHVVWFGESVPMMDRAIEIVSKAEIFIIIGTSLQVYPAASLLYYAPENSRIYLVDKNIPVVRQAANMTFIAKTAVEGVPELVNKLLEKDE
ncbi:MAG: NAD-dependent deacylase [Sphingobacteriales bacterium]|nr:NAD-dependent deacylase [Sphingobacteriales bacterium]